VRQRSEINAVRCVERLEAKRMIDPGMSIVVGCADAGLENTTPRQRRAATVAIR
jgi:hypothetical protein